MPVETVDQGLYARLVQVAQVARGLARLLARHHVLRVDAPERVNDDFAADRLDGVDDDRHGARVELLEGLSVCQLQSRSLSQSLRVGGSADLLSVDVDARQPAAETRVGVVPPNHHLWPAGLLEHVEHFRLEHMVDRLDRNGRS